MDVIRIGRKGRHLNTLEKYHIYKISRNNLHMNETVNAKAHLILTSKSTPMKYVSTEIQHLDTQEI
jgi:hypothetical protein